MSKGKLEERIAKLENDIRTIAGVVNTTAVFVNALIKHTGISNEKLNAAVAEATLQSAERKSIRSAETGTTVSDSGDRGQRVFDKPSDRDLERLDTDSTDSGQNRDDSRSSEPAGNGSN